MAGGGPGPAHLPAAHRGERRGEGRGGGRGRGRGDCAIYLSVTLQRHVSIYRPPVLSPVC